MLLKSKGEKVRATFGPRVCLLGRLAVWSIVSGRTQQLNLRGRGVIWGTANSQWGPRLWPKLRLWKVAHVLTRGTSRGSRGGRQLLQGQHLWALQHGSQTGPARGVQVGHRGPGDHGPRGANSCGHSVLGIGRMRVGVAGSLLWPGFMPHRGWDSTVIVVEWIHQVGVLHARPTGSPLALVVHARPHVVHAHHRRAEAWVVVLRWPRGARVSVAHGVRHGVTLRPLVRRVHATFRRGPRLKGHRARPQRGAVGRTHVGVLLLVLRQEVARVRTHRVSGNHVVAIAHVMLESKTFLSEYI